MTTLKDSTKVLYTETIIAICITAVIFFFVFRLAFTITESREKVVSTSNAGAAMTANFIDGGFSTDKTRLETDTGIYLVNGSILLKKGERFTLEERQNGMKFLCRTGSKDCYSLAE